jgi:hypothetical protein
MWCEIERGGEVRGVVWNVNCKSDLNSMRMLINH